MNPGVMMTSHEGAKIRRKDSVPVPSGWEFRRLKYVGTVVSGTGFPHEYQGAENEELPFLKVSDMSAAGSEKWVSRATNSVSRSTAKQLGATVVPENSVVYAKIGAALLLNKRRLLTNPSCIDNNMSAFVPRAVVPEWALWWLTTLDFGEYVNPGAIPSFTEGQQKELPFLVPPIETQHLIADYLDRETARIDALVAEKEKMLALLEEKRVALISRAVTRGLDPTAPLKPSGLDWLGDIPAHWETRRLKYLTHEPLAYGANEAALEDNPDWPRFVRITDINEDGTLRDETFRSLSPEIAEPYLLERGDVLFARSGATVGKTFIYRPEWGEACFAGYLIRFRSAQELVLPDFVYFFSLSDIYWQQVESGTIQATIQNFSAEKYAELIVCLPPPSEQQAIVDFLINAELRTSTLLAEIRNSIERLKERRAALITAAVTGQISIEEMRI